MHAEEVNAFGRGRHGAEGLGSAAREGFDDGRHCRLCISIHPCSPTRRRLTDVLQTSWKEPSCSTRFALSKSPVEVFHDTPRRSRTRSSSFSDTAITSSVPPRQQGSTEVNTPVPPLPPSLCSPTSLQARRNPPQNKGSRPSRGNEVHAVVAEEVEARATDFGDGVVLVLLCARVDDFAARGRVKGLLYGSTEEGVDL